jgi:predicted NBD/HSP70 family sugar kinase
MEQPRRLGIGLDIGGTSTRAGLVDHSGAVVALATIVSRRGADGVVTAACEAVDAVLHGASLSMDDVDVVGVGIPGAVDPVRGSVHHAVNLGIGREGVELGERLRTALGAVVHVENDVRAAALGADWYVTNERGEVTDLAYLSVGTGIAAGYVERGRLHRGSRFVAGEIGHIPIDPRGPDCACGQVGCLEAIASGAAIERMWPTTDSSPAVALQLAAAAGDPDAQRIWNAVVVGLGRAVLMLALTWDPEIVVISGGVASLGPVLRDAIAQTLDRDGKQAQFLESLDLGARLSVIEPSVPLGPIGAVRAARAAQVVPLS